MKDTKMQPAKDAVIEELRELAEDLYVNGYNRYSSAMSQAADELERLRAKIEEMEIGKREISEAHNVAKRRLSALAGENIALQAKIVEMERQEPVAEIGQQYTLLFAGSGSITGVVKRHGLKIGDKLYALPGAKGE